MSATTFLEKVSNNYTVKTDSGNFGSTSILSEKLSFQLSVILFEENTFNDELLENINTIEKQFNLLFDKVENLSATLSFSKNGNYIYCIKFKHPEFSFYMDSLNLISLLNKLNYLIAYPFAFDQYIKGHKTYIEGQKPFKCSLFVIKDQNGYKTKVDYKYTQDISEAEVFSTEKSHYEHSLTCDVVHRRLNKDYVRIYISK